MKNIIVTTDLSSESTKAFALAKEQVDAIGADICQIILLTVLEEVSPSTAYVELGLAPIVDEPIRKEWIRKTRIALTELQEEHFSGYRVSQKIAHSSKSVGAEITALAKEYSSEMIIISSHGRSGINRFLLGSVAEKVVNTAPCSVLIVFNQAVAPETARQEVRQILVLTDFSESSFSAFPTAKQQLAVGSKDSSQITLLHVCEDITRATFGMTLGLEALEIAEDMKQKAERQLAEVKAQVLNEPLANTVVLVSDRPIYETIATYAKQHHIELIITATHGRSGATKFLLGGVTEKLIRSSPCPILVARTKKSAD